MDEKASMYTCGTVNGENIQLPPNMNVPGLDGEKLAKQLKEMKTVSFTVRVTDEFSLEGNAGMKDGDAADDFGDTLSQLFGTVKGFLPLVSGQNPKFKPLADEVGKTLKSSVKSKDVSMSLKISADSINQALGQID